MVSKKQSEEHHQLYFGEKVQNMKNQLDLSYPISEGIIKNWEDMQLIWNYAFEEVGCRGSGESILITEPIMNPLKNREKMGEMLFETFNFERVQIGI